MANRLCPALAHPERPGGQRPDHPRFLGGGGRPLGGDRLRRAGASRGRRLDGLLWTAAEFVGTEGISYSFRLQAADRVGNTSEWTTSGSSSVQSVTKYYYFGSQRVALRRGSGAGSKVYYLHGDHLGSTSLVTDQSGSIVSESRYAPFGSVRWAWGRA